MATELNTGFPIYIIIYFIIYFLYLKEKEKSLIFWYSCFIIYIFLVVDVTIFPIPTSIERIQYNFSLRENSSIWNSVNLIPNISPDNILSRNFFLNMIMTGPFGFLTNILFIKDNRFKYTLKYSLILTLSIEFIQFLFRYFTASFKIVDVDDVIANVTGAIIGLLLYYAYDFISRKLSRTN